MATFLGNIRYVAWTGIALALIFLLTYATVGQGREITDAGVVQAFLRWSHVLVGIMWIGHLYYFNFTQIPNMPKIPDEQKPAIGKVIAPAALFWFRWGAMATLVTGVLLTMNQGYLLQAYTLGGADDPSFAVPKHILIGIGMWLATIMWFNVWFIIWPNQQKILGLVEATAEQKAAAVKPALYASRFNTMFSIGMLYCMVAQQNAPV